MGQISSAEYTPLLENALRSSSHMLATALSLTFHSSFITIALRLLSLASVLRSPRSSWRASCDHRAIFALLIVAHAIENTLRVLRSSMLPCSRTPYVHIVAHSCNSLALIVALACNSPVHTRRPSSSLILIKHRALIHAKAGELLAHA
jgi:hypothetical protein